MFEIQDIIGIFKILIASVIMAVLMNVIYKALGFMILSGFSGWLIIGLAGGVSGLLVYIVLCFVFKVDILLDFIKGVRQK